MAGAAAIADRGRRSARPTVRTDRAGFDLNAGAGPQRALLHGRELRPACVRSAIGATGCRRTAIGGSSTCVGNRQQAAGLLPADRGGEVER